LVGGGVSETSSAGAAAAAKATDSKALFVYVVASERLVAQMSTTRDSEGFFAGGVKCCSRWSAKVSPSWTRKYASPFATSLDALETT
jgi:hypothetical protein